MTQKKIKFFYIIKHYVKTLFKLIYNTNVSISIDVLSLFFSVTEWEGETLELTKISRLDMGAYLCIASNGVPPSVSKRIKVSVDCKYLSFIFNIS